MPMLLGILGPISRALYRLIWRPFSDFSSASAYPLSHVVALPRDAKTPEHYGSGVSPTGEWMRAGKANRPRVANGSRP